MKGASQLIMSLTSGLTHLNMLTRICSVSIVPCCIFPSTMGRSGWKDVRTTSRLSLPMKAALRRRLFSSSHAMSAPHSTYLWVMPLSESRKGTTRSAVGWGFRLLLELKFCARAGNVLHPANRIEIRCNVLSFID